MHREVQRQQRKKIFRCWIATNHHTQYVQTTRTKTLGISPYVHTSPIGIVFDGHFVPTINRQRGGEGLKQN